jgi:hypothetical protein
MLSNQMKPITISWGMMAEIKYNVDLHKIVFVCEKNPTYNVYLMQ